MRGCRTRACAAILAATLASSCGWAEYWSHGNYLVYDIDGTGAALGYRLADGNVIRRAPPEILRVGVNDAYVVALSGGGVEDTEVFYYVEMARDGPYLDADDITVGPLSATEFQAARATLNLPMPDREISTGFWGRWF